MIKLLMNYNDMLVEFFLIRMKSYFQIDQSEYVFNINAVIYVIDDK